MDAIETIEHKGKTIEIYYDESPDSPREWDNLGTIVYKHRRYTLGDSEIPEYFTTETGETVYIQSTDDIRQWITQAYGEIAVILPVYIHEHSGIALSTGSFSDPWDSGQCGYIFTTKKRLQKEYNTKRITKSIKEKAQKILEGEIETYSQYVNGEVYGYMAGDDSCWGYYSKDDAIAVAKSIIDCQVERENKKRQERVKQYIKNKVPLHYRTV